MGSPFSKAQQIFKKSPRKINTAPVDMPSSERDLKERKIADELIMSLTRTPKAIVHMNRHGYK